MNKNILAGALLFCVLLFTGAGCFSKKAPTDSVADSGSSSIDSDASNGSFVGNMADALKLGKSMKCTWSSDEGEGVSYIKGEKMYTETTTDGMTAFMVGDGECTYIWEEGKSDGAKFCLSGDDFAIGDFEVDDSEFEDKLGNQQGLEDAGVDMDMDMNCRPANVKNSQFAVPSDVEFVDPFAELGDMFENLDVGF